MKSAILWGFLFVFVQAEIVHGNVAAVFSDYDQANGIRRFVRQDYVDPGFEDGVEYQRADGLEEITGPYVDGTADGVVDPLNVNGTEQVDERGEVVDDYPTDDIQEVDQKAFETPIAYDTIVDDNWEADPSNAGGDRADVIVDPPIIAEQTGNEPEGEPLQDVAPVENQLDPIRNRRLKKPASAAETSATKTSPPRPTYSAAPMPPPCSQPSGQWGATALGCPPCWSWILGWYIPPKCRSCPVTWPWLCWLCNWSSNFWWCPYC